GRGLRGRGRRRRDPALDDRERGLPLRKPGGDRQADRRVPRGGRGRGRPLHHRGRPPRERLCLCHGVRGVIARGPVMGCRPASLVEDVSGGHGRPELWVKRLLLVGTGSVSVSELPFWLGWLNVSYPELDVRVAITRSAERFVTRSSLAA